ncbi:MAG: hypothetical protein EBX52_02650 [Proteobacteria bacterium]|nr:hypothetical protein [Pseudomonadota bacterium]
MDMSATLDKIKEQEWYQQIQGAFQQLSPEQQNQVRWGSLIAAFLIALYVIYAVTSAAGSARNEYYEKQELARVISEANDELRRLKGQNSGMSQGQEQNWKTLISNLAGSQGIPADHLEIVKEQPGKARNAIQETLVEVQIKGTALPSLVQMLTQIERGSPPMKLKGLRIEPSAEGQLNAKLNLSGYLGKSEKGEKSK